MKVAIAGVGMTKFGELWDKSIFDLAEEASVKAIEDSGLDTKKIDAVFVANMLSSKLDGQDHLGAVVATLLGLSVSAVRIEGACASGGLAVHQAVAAILSGIYETVLVLGVEKMTDVSTCEITTALMGAGAEEERLAGLTFPGLYALMARAHMEEFGTTREQMAQVAVKNHFHASLNEHAHFPFEVSIEKVLGSPSISYPFTLFDSSPISDGAAAVVLTKKSVRKGVAIRASTVATDTIGLAKRKSLTEVAATKIAGEKALRQAGVSLSDIDVLEVHDCFTVAEIMAMEDLGFCEKGEGGQYVSSGQTKLGSKMPVNTSGGLKACGHPLAATGVKQIVEITNQLRGNALNRQVKGAKVGLAQNVGGTGATVVVHVLQV
ncbi:thiolase domain-containing protein [Candidatus Shapirobacteria bacterium]|nr:thiolase domain-containing protein [Candidatus Shapirobacteria bacterium]